MNIAHLVIMWIPAGLFVLLLIAPLLSLAEAGQRSQDRRSIIARAKVWSATDIPSADLRRGPTGPGAFQPGQARRG